MAEPGPALWARLRSAPPTRSIEELVSLEALLSEKRSAILERWIRQILETYPSDTQVFLRSQGDQFANPVGHRISGGLQALFDVVARGGDLEAARQRLDDILRIRAVQEFSPAMALAFVFGLKDAARAELADQADEPALAADWRAFDSRVDQLALLAFEVYEACRQNLYEIRLMELRNQVLDVREKVALRKARQKRAQGGARAAGAEDALVGSEENRNTPDKDADK